MHIYVRTYTHATYALYSKHVHLEMLGGVFMYYSR